MSLLRVENLSKSFGGVHAVQDLSFEIPEKTIYSVIGPNGAGKTTLFNLITSVYTPTSGNILFKGQEISEKKSHQLAGLGISRTFQNLQICMNMTAVENVMLGRHLHLNDGFFAAMLRLPSISTGDVECREKAIELMEFVGVNLDPDTHADSMAYGQLKRLEIARALASEPDILLLDEPAAGLNHNETGEIDALIQKVADSGTTVVLVEHDMKLVMNISDHILVLNYGKKLAEGTAAEIRRNLM